MEKELVKIAYIYGDVCVRKKRQRRKRQKLLVTEMLYDYAENSTLHGLRYIVERGLSVIEKLFWFITVVVSIGLCSVYIRDVYQKWITTPIIVTVNGRLSSVGTVPFPAVTICPEVKVDQQKYNYTEAQEKYYEKSLHGKKLDEFRHISLMCDEVQGLDTAAANVSLVEAIVKVAPKFQDIFYECKWHNLDCGDIFKKVFTEQGVCYTANSLAASDIFKNTIQSDYPYLESSDPQEGWSLETGYDYSVKKSYPRRGRVFGSEPDMQVILIHNPNIQDKGCNQLYSGYKIYLQHPADFPQSSLYYYAAIPNQITSLAISFHEFNSDSTLISYNPEIRQCYFPNDRELRYFKIYTPRNCQAECLSNYTMSVCNCVGFYMPHDKSSQICTASSVTLECMVTAKDAMAQIEINIALGLKTGGCRCLPLCNSIEYDAEILKTDYFLAELMEESRTYNSTNSYSKLDLYFKKPQFVTMQRREVFGVTDFLANIGGLLGLFLGFSFLSLIEIFYFLTLRVGFTLKRDLEKEKKQTEFKL